MSSTQATSSPLANLPAPPKSVNRGQEGGKGFEQLLQGQVQASVRDIPQQPVKPAAASERRPEAAKKESCHAKETEASTVNPQSENSAALEQTEASGMQEQASSTQEEPAEQTDTATHELVDVGAAQASVWLVQLQQYVRAAIDVAQEQADEAAQPVLKHAGLAQALQVDKAEPSQLVDDKKPLPLAMQAERQQLPLPALNTEAQVLQTDFSKLLNDTKQGLQLPSSGMTNISVARPEPLRASAGEGLRHAYTLHQGVGESAWGRELGSKVVMMVSMQHQEVEMHLNPPNLGPLEVKLSLNQDQASLTFVAATSSVREALQASMPKLTEMMAETGITLGQVSVESRGQQGEPSADQRERKSRTSGGGSEERLDISNARAIRSSLGNVNLFV